MNYTNTTFSIPFSYVTTPNLKDATDKELLDECKQRGIEPKTESEA